MTKFNSKILLLAVLWLLIMAPASEAQTSRTGTTSANFLKIGVDARALGMAGAAVSLPGNAMTVYWNPALLGTLQQFQVGFMHHQYIAEMAHEYAAFATALNPNYQFAFAFSYFNAGTIEQTERTAAGEFEKLGTLSAYDLALYFSLSRHLGKNFFTGISLKPIVQTIGDYSGQGIGADFGLLYLKNQFGFGLAMKNIGTPIKFDKESYPLPAVFSLGISYSFKEILCLSSELEQPIDNRLEPKIGFELKPISQFQVRAGYNFGQLHAELGKSAGLAIGAGLNFRNINLDYAYNPMGFFGNSHRISLIYRFEEKESPGLTMSVQPEIITPDGDGDAETCEFDFAVTGCLEPGKWILKITDAKETTVRVWRGAGDIQKRIYWDAKIESGELVAPGFYHYSLEIQGCDGKNKLRNTGTIQIQYQIEKQPAVEKIPVAEPPARYEKKTFTIGDILFDTNSAVIRSNDESQLNQVVAFLREYPEARIFISGHTDDQASNEYNMQLSLARANSIMNYLLKNTTLDPNQIATQGFGETQPLVANSSAENRQKNRRVEILIYYLKKNSSANSDAPGNTDFRSEEFNPEKLKELSDLVRFAALKYDLYYRHRSANRSSEPKQEAENAELKAALRAQELGFGLVKAVVQNESSLYEVVSPYEVLSGTDSWKQFFTAWDGKLTDLSELHPGQAVFILYRKK